MVVIELEIRKAAMAAPKIAINSWGADSMITAILPPEIRKLPNTVTNKTTMPMIGNMYRAPGSCAGSFSVNA